MSNQKRKIEEDIGDCVIERMPNKERQQSDTAKEPEYEKNLQQSDEFNNYSTMGAERPRRPHTL